MCSGSVSPHHVLRAFQEGVDGVLIGGCRLGECHYQTGNYMTEKRMLVLKKILPFYGIESERLRVRWVSSAEASELAATIADFTDELLKLGPSPLRRYLVKSGK
jgi:F420-non-reducing hydrogenase iron-sulfur subunit